MRGWAICVCACGLAACGARVEVSSDAPPGQGPDGPIGPPPPDAAPGVDAMLGAWSMVAPIPAAATPGMGEDDGAPSSTETEMVFSGKLSGVAKDIYVTTRNTVLDPWGTAAAVAELNTTATEQTPRITADGLSIYFSSARSGGPGADDIWMSTRSGPGSPWQPPTVVPIVNSAQDERTLTPCQGGRYLMISFRTGSGDVYEGVLGGAAPTLVASLSSAATETGTFVSADCLRAWFASTRDGTNDIFYGHRATVGDPWILDGKVTELSTDTDDESDPWVSPDGHRMVFTSNADGENDVYQASR